MPEDKRSTTFVDIGDFVVPVANYVGEPAPPVIHDPPPPGTQDMTYAGHRRVHVSPINSMPIPDGNSQELRDKIAQLEARTTEGLHAELRDSGRRLRQLTSSRVSHDATTITYHEGNQLVTEKLRQLYARNRMLDLYDAYLHTADGQKGLIPKGMRDLLEGPKKRNGKKGKGRKK